MPATPSNPPASDPEVTSPYQIKVTYNAVDDDGGLPVLAYEVQVASTSLTDWETFTMDKLQTNFIITRVVSGENYAFRYRAVNIVGPSDWSTYAIIKAAGVPISPPKPAYISSTDSSITL